VVLVLYTDTVRRCLLRPRAFVAHSSISFALPQILIAGVSYWLYRRNRSAAA
jgi:hypothetical protein